ncbi:MAG: TIGR04282 family arsenosugar biosynthesis glycosyltransferase [Bradymonadaceae bacterium]
MRRMLSENDIAPNALVVFAKPPEPGEVKTRLTDRIDETTAARLYRAFLRDTAARVTAVAASLDEQVTPVLAYTGRPDHPTFEAFWDRDCVGVDQGGGDLGDKMNRVSRRCLEAGADRVLIVGSDSPTLLNRHYREAYRRLETTDVVLGPSFDGGYYLVGMTDPRPAIFEGIDWSTPSVLEQTVRRCRDNQLLCELIEFWYDIDTFEDLRRLKFHLLEYLAAGDQTVAPETAEMVRGLDADGFPGADGS